MATTVRITVLTGPHKGRRFCFRGPAQCSVGRSQDCFLHLCGTARDEPISRHHCSLAILATDPPCVRLEDLGSLNGTYLNGTQVQPHDPDLKYLAALLGKECLPAVRDGDVITVAGTSLQVNMVDCPPHGIAVNSVWQGNEVAKRDCAVPCSFTVGIV